MEFGTHRDIELTCDTVKILDRLHVFVKFVVVGTSYAAFPSTVGDHKTARCLATQVIDVLLDGVVVDSLDRFNPSIVVHGAGEISINVSEARTCR